jgi:hypothetical protein
VKWRYTPPFLTSTLDGCEYSVSSCDQFTPRGRSAPDVHFIQVFMVSESIWKLQCKEILFPCRESNPGPPNRNPSPYSLSYPSPLIFRVNYLCERTGFRHGHFPCIARHKIRTKHSAPTFLSAQGLCATAVLSIRPTGVALLPALAHCSAMTWPQYDQIAFRSGVTEKEHEHLHKGVKRRGLHCQ